MAQDKKKLTIKQKRFVEAVANPNVKSQKEAAIMAGYAPNRARITAAENVSKSNISEAIQRRINRVTAHHKVTPEEVLGSAVFNMRSSMDDLMDEEGFFDLAKARETGAVDLIKEIEFDQSIDLDTGTKRIRHKVKFESPAAARKEVANYIGLEQIAAQKPGTIIILTDETKARELLKRMMEIHGWEEEKAIAGIKERFPEVDEAKLLGD